MRIVYAQKELGGVVKPAESFWTLGGFFSVNAADGKCNVITVFRSFLRY